MTPLEADVLRLLRIPTTIAELAILIGVPRRDIESAVESLRLQGHPIVGGSAGLWLVDNATQLDAYIEARRRRMVAMYLGTRALRRTARRLRERDDLTLWPVSA